MVSVVSDDLLSVSGGESETSEERVAIDKFGGCIKGARYDGNGSIITTIIKLSRIMVSKVEKFLQLHKSVYRRGRLATAQI